MKLRVVGEIAVMKALGIKRQPTVDWIGHVGHQWFAAGSEEFINWIEHRIVRQNK